MTLGSKFNVQTGQAHLFYPDAEDKAHIESQIVPFQAIVIFCWDNSPLA